MRSIPGKRQCRFPGALFWGRVFGNIYQNWSEGKGALVRAAIQAEFEAAVDNAKAGDTILRLIRPAPRGAGFFAQKSRRLYAACSSYYRFCSSMNRARS